MKERPILFSAPMVRALLAGTKTQTRRALRVQPPAATGQVSTWHHPDPRPMFFAWVGLPDGGAEISGDWQPVPCPYGQPGDQLWVRETWNVSTGCIPAISEPFIYRADLGPSGVSRWAAHWQPSIFMPRAASRITLVITGVRVERLQDISRGDAMTEGCPFPNMAAGPDPRRWYADLWNQINGADSWDANPWVWCLSFDVRRKD